MKVNIVFHLFCFIFILTGSNAYSQNDGLKLFSTENTLLACSDGVDNDGDGRIDCADSQCGEQSSCLERTSSCQPLDIWFCLDESSSVDDQEWLHAKNFIKKYCDGDHFKNDFINAGLFSFSGKKEQYVHFGLQGNASDFDQQINNYTRRFRGNTRVNKAGDYYYDHLMAQGRSDAKQIIIFLTDAFETYDNTFAWMRIKEAGGEIVFLLIDEAIPDAIPDARTAASVDGSGQPLVFASITYEHLSTSGILNAIKSTVNEQSCLLVENDEECTDGIDNDGDGLIDCEDPDCFLYDSDRDGICDVNDPCDDRTIGQNCNDGDDCTTNDTISVDCQCNGTYSDTDEDTFCDAVDLCPMFDDRLIGSDCDDGDDCTTNDTISVDCQCNGTYIDTDEDTFCDAVDLCPMFDDRLIGSDCDDGDDCTTNDTISVDCQCNGTYIDTDEDTFCDAVDLCPMFDDRLIGTDCDDGDDCTSNDTISVDCQCNGTYIDTDEDTFCDAVDLCPMFDDRLIGTDCDDGDDCTSNDTISVDCHCNGTYSDTDEDTFCDAVDLCPMFDDRLIGTDCDDGDDCTTNDTISVDCQCNGTYIDTDEDTFCDAVDLCPMFDDRLIGTDCDDGDDCTTNDTISVDCQCNGTYIDTDDDTFCDAVDLCPMFDDRLIGSDCDDGDDCTTNDTISVDCQCNGTYIDTDEDTFCDAVDRCPMFDDRLIGSDCDDGDDCTTNDTISVDCHCNGTYIDTDEDTFCDAVDLCPMFDDRLIGTDCDDGDDCTTNDTISVDCRCNGTYSDTDEDTFCDAVDLCPMFDDRLIGTDCDDGDDCTTNDTISVDCQCNGTYSDIDEDTFCDAVDRCPMFDDRLIGSDCDDGDDCTTNDTISVDCQCNGTYSDTDEDTFCDAVDLCPMFDDRLIGSDCDDGDDCTTNDTISVDCQCNGTYSDTDEDTFCDAVDLCPMFDDRLIGTDCDDGDDCTTNDQFTNDCNCEGEILDSDGDGIPDCEDIDPDDPCNPQITTMCSFDLSLNAAIEIDSFYEVPAQIGDTMVTTIILCNDSETSISKYELNADIIDGVEFLSHDDWSSWIEGDKLIISRDIILNNGCDTIWLYAIITDEESEDHFQYQMEINSAFFLDGAQTDHDIDSHFDSEKNEEDINEDDNDLIVLPILDIALQLSADIPTTLQKGDTLPITVTLINQANIPVDLVTIVHDFNPILQLMGQSDYEYESINATSFTSSITKMLNIGEEIQYTIFMKVIETPSPENLQFMSEIYSVNYENYHYTFDIDSRYGSSLNLAKKANNLKSNGEDDTDILPLNVMDLSLEVTPENISVLQVGEIVELNISVENFGNMNAQQIEIRQYLPYGLEVVPAANHGWQQIDQYTLSRTVNSLIAGEMTEFTLPLQAMIPTSNKINTTTEIYSAQYESLSLLSDFDSQFGSVDGALFINQLQDDEALFSMAAIITCADTDTSYTCIGSINMSINGNCRGILTPNMILPNTGLPDDAFSMMIIDANGNEVDSLFTHLDVGQTFTAMVALAGCTGGCSSAVNIEDKTSPIVVCSTDTISCIDALRQDIPLVVIDNCGPLDTFSSPPIIDMLCDSQLVQRIIRTVRVEDASGNISNTCNDTTYVSRINVDSIEFPMDTILFCDDPTIFDENGVVLPSIAGEPTLEGMPLYSSDLLLCNTQVVFHDNIISETSCSKTIFRTWVAVEWNCMGESMMQKPQIIKIMDTLPPKIQFHYNTLRLNADSKFCDLSTPLPYIESFVDNCATNFSVLLTINNQYLGSYTGGNVTLPLDTSTVIYQVFDECSNVVRDTLIVIVSDVTPPGNNCLTRTTINLNDTSGTWVSAFSFDNGTTDNCDDDLVLRARRMEVDTFAEGVMFNCDDADSVIMVVLQSMDDAGNIGTCMIAVTVSDKDSLCGTPSETTMETFATISGDVLNFRDEPIEQALLTLANSSSEKEISNSEGDYAFNSMPTGNWYSLNAEKEGGFDTAAINSIDLLMIQEFILYGRGIESPYQLLAADLNGDFDISMQDVQLLQQLILNNYNLEDYWRFYPKTQSYETVFDILGAPIPEFYEFVPLRSDEIVNFIGLINGDVNGDAMNQESQGRTLHKLTYNWLEMGDFVEVTIYPGIDVDLLALQTTFEFDPNHWDFINIQSAGLKMNTSNINTKRKDEGAVALVWSDPERPDFLLEEPLFRIQLHKKHPNAQPYFSFSSRVTNSMLITGEIVADLILEERTTDAASNIDITYQPNPWSSFITMNYYMEKDGFISFHFYDQLGRTLLQKNLFEKQGNHQLIVDKSELPVVGLHFCEIVIGDDSKVIKLLREE